MAGLNVHAQKIAIKDTINPRLSYAGQKIEDAAIFKLTSNVTALAGGGMITFAAVSKSADTEVFYWVGGGLVAISITCDFISWRNLRLAGRRLQLNAGINGFKLKYRI
jgi:hypothetical protein